jgi:hypothetical protein
VQGGVYLLYLHSFAFKYRYILYNSHSCGEWYSALRALGTALGTALFWPLLVSHLAAGLVGNPPLVV